MDYNPRMSMAPRGSQQSSQQKPKRDDDEDAFMKLVRKPTTRRDQTWSRTNKHCRKILKSRAASAILGSTSP
jgi:hypothetical protein